MNNKLENIYNFQCPRWEELPNKPMFSSEVVEYISKILSPIIIDEEEILTSTMIQNYVKWEVIPRPNGKKYGREHIARLIVIVLLKRVLQINTLKKGFTLQLDLMAEEDSYNKFCNILEESLRNLLHNLKNNKPFKLDEKKPNEKDIGITIVIYSFTFNLLSNLIINNNGFEILKDY